MFENQRKDAVRRMQFGYSEVVDGEKDLKELNSYLTASAICQEIGIQAAFAAATMGAAGALTGALANSARASAVMASLGNVRVVGGAVNALARVGGMSSGTTGAAALTGIVARATSGVFFLMVRRATGDLGTKEAMNFDGIGMALFLTVATAWVGSPGSKSATSLPLLKRLVTQLPSAVSAQGATQAMGVVLAGAKTWMADPAGKSALQEINANRAEFDRQIDMVAEAQVKQLILWALQTQLDMHRDLEKQCDRFNFAAQMPALARWFDFRDHAGTLNILTKRVVKGQASLELWVKVSHTISAIQQSVEAAKAMGK